jgi:hypothetical protein
MSSIMNKKSSIKALKESLGELPDSRTCRGFSRVAHPERAWKFLLLFPHA